MYIEYNQFLKLVSEACNMDLENTEKQLSLLIGEINQSLTDGEAYEIEGFGIFSSIGNKLMFNPSNELETEINYKYVGMDPIELDIPEPTFEDPCSEVEDDSITKSFDGLTEEAIIDPLLVSNENSEADGIDASKGKIDIDDDLGDVFADPFEQNNEDNVAKEIASIMEEIFVEEEQPSLNNEQVNFDTVEDDSNKEPGAERLNQLLNEKENYEDLSDINTLDDDTFEHNHTEENIIGIEDPKTEKEDTSEFDDPFLSIQDEQFDESPDQLEDIIDNNTLPVIRNTHTDILNSDQSKTKAHHKQKNKIKEVHNTSNRKKKHHLPVWFWLITILVLSNGLIFGLTFLKVIDLPFINFEKNNSDVSMVEQTPLVQQTDEDKIPRNVTTSSNNREIEAEQVTEPAVQENESIVSTSSPDRRYGLTGEVTELGNDGYTIVLFTLKNKNNAINEVQKLVNAGYRAFLTPIRNERIGIMYRVSLGQFSSLFNAAIASAEAENLLPENYIIKKIN